MVNLGRNTPEETVHDASRGRVLIMGVKAYERMRFRPDAKRIIIIDRQIPPTVCNRLNHREFWCGGLTFAMEIAHEDPILYDVEG